MEGQQPVSKRIVARRIIIERDKVGDLLTEKACAAIFAGALGAALSEDELNTRRRDRLDGEARRP